MVGHKYYEHAGDGTHNFLLKVGHSITRTPATMNS